MPRDLGPRYGCAPSRTSDAGTRTRRLGVGVEVQQGSRSVSGTATRCATPCSPLAGVTAPGGCAMPHHRRMTRFEDALRGVGERLAKQRDEARIPGVAWGVIRGGELVHTGGAGTMRDGAERVPDADTVFWIASMTKSFTAATVLSLRDEGRLRLDDEVATFVPELAAWRHPASDAPPITIRHLLTMSAGLPTDDPWGDRQQGLPLDRFADLLRGGISTALPPDTRVEYSNLGYGILRRVITAVPGIEYDAVVRTRFLEPLGMTSTTYQLDAVPRDRLAVGYAKRDGTWTPDPIDPYGALAPMGGVFTTVTDLSRWVAGFIDAFP